MKIFVSLEAFSLVAGAALIYRQWAKMLSWNSKQDPAPH